LTRHREDGFENGGVVDRVGQYGVEMLVAVDDLAVVIVVDFLLQHYYGAGQRLVFGPVDTGAGCRQSTGKRQRDQGDHEPLEWQWHAVGVLLHGAGRIPAEPEWRHPGLGQAGWTRRILDQGGTATQQRVCKGCVLVYRIAPGLAQGTWLEWHLIRH